MNMQAIAMPSNRVPPQTPDRPPTDRVEWLKKRGQLTPRQAEAADRLARDDELATSQSYARIQADRDPGGGFVSPQDRITAADRRIKKISTITSGLAAQVLTRVVLQNMTLQSTARELKKDQAAIAAALECGLDQVANFYEGIIVMAVKQAPSTEWDSAKWTPEHAGTVLERLTNWERSQWHRACAAARKAKGPQPAPEAFLGLGAKRGGRKSGE